MEDWELVEASGGRREMASDASIRDYFAAKAMQGVMGSGTAMRIGTNHREAMLDMAVAFYSMADAMLEARNMGQ